MLDRHIGGDGTDIGTTRTMTPPTWQMVVTTLGAMLLVALLAVSFHCPDRPRRQLTVRGQQTRRYGD